MLWKSRIRKKADSSSVFRLSDRSGVRHLDRRKAEIEKTLFLAINSLRQPECEETMDLNRLKSAINISLDLSKSGQYDEAFRLLDVVIAEAVEERNSSRVLMLCHHAAILSQRKGDLPLRRHYYEQSLAYSPENPMALYGLADAAHEEGRAEDARRYAERCHRAILQTNDEIVRRGLLDLVLTRWPDSDR
jgi:tetratricopeptide (TPR) repeat protein